MSQTTNHGNLEYEYDTEHLQLKIESLQGKPSQSLTSSDFLLDCTAGRYW